MAYVTPIYDLARVDAAGAALAARTETQEDREVINNWRWAHHRPLVALRVNMNRRATHCDPKGSFVAQRLKRFESIGIKLYEKPRLTLSMLQDIGGCRAVMGDVSKVQALVAACTGAKEFSTKLIANLGHDYIAKPKADGYRSVHLVYGYESEDSRLRIYNGMRLELQVRTELQHAWATAVEITSTYTTTLRRYSDISSEWKRFFVLASAAVAMDEACALVPGTPTDRAALKGELAEVSRKLSAGTKLAGWRAAIKISGEKEQENRRLGREGHYLLSLNMEARTVLVRWYPDSDTAKAAQQSLVTETKKPNLQTVVVAARNQTALRRAYPNYFVHTEKFLAFLTGFLAE